jgi:hypothetical protein
VSRGNLGYATVYPTTIVKIVIAQVALILLA